MAIISKIRSNSALLVVVLGLGLAAFLLMDMFGQGGMFGGQPTLIGEVNGEKIDIQEFNQVEQSKFSGGGANRFAQKASTWNYLIEDKLIRAASEELGLNVTDDEKRQLLFSDNQFELSPVIRNIFVNPNTRAMDMNSFRQFKQNFATSQSDPQFQRQWKEVENEVEKNALQTKYQNLVTKGLYAPSWMVEQVQKQGSKTVSFEFVKIPFDEISDAEVNVTDEDLKNYLAKNEKMYTTKEETRTLGMAVISVLPTASDSAKLQSKVKTILDGFANSSNDSLYTVNQEGNLTTYVTKEEFDFSFTDQVFQEPVGTILGPIEENGAYVGIKILDRKTLPDSVTARHILRRTATQADFNKAKSTIDSLKIEIEKGAIGFAEAAQQFSEDGSAPEGGDLGTFGPGRMVKPFNDMVFHEAKKGELNVVVSQFGVHLIEVTNQKYIENKQGVKLALFNEPIIPSEATQDEIYKQANSIISTAASVDDLKKAADASPNVEFMESNPLAKNDFTVSNLRSGESSREMVRWAFATASQNEVSNDVYTFENPQLYFNEKYAVVALKGVQAAGKPTIDGVRSIITPMVQNQKKHEMLNAKIKGQDLNQLASTYSTDVDTAKDVSFSSSFIPGVGVEPAVVSQALAGKTDTKAILGNNGLYVIKVIGTQENPLGGNVADFRKVAASPAVQQVGSRLISSIRKAATIEDNRFLYF